MHFEACYFDKCVFKLLTYLWLRILITLVCENELKEVVGGYR